MQPTTNSHTNQFGSAATTYSPDLDSVTKAVAKRSFATLATVSPAGRPHSAGVLYAAVGTTIYVNTDGQSRKVRNIAENPHVGVSIPIRRLPVGPPSLVFFQGTAEVLALNDPHVVKLTNNGELKSITSHGEMDNPRHVFLRITPGQKINTHGLGMSLRTLIKDPIGAAGSIELPSSR